MIHDTSLVKDNGTTAPLRNVGQCVAAMDAAMNRESHLPGMVVFYGPSGYGKSTAAAYVANLRRAYRIEVQETWTRRYLAETILKEMGISDMRGTIPALVEKIQEQLTLSGRPLIIDEMDFVVDRGMISVVSDIYRGSAATIILIGEEKLPTKLAKWEKFHGRILEWVPAQPVNMKDAQHLRALYVKKIELADDLLAHLVKIAEGSARRICVNFDRIERMALADGVARMDLATWGDRDLYTGKVPARRA